MAKFYVYKATKHREPYPYNWELASTHDDIAAAETAARSLCPNRHSLDTEPGHGLQQAFFGPAGSKKWSSMIETKDIHAER